MLDMMFSKSKYEDWAEAQEYISFKAMAWHNCSSAYLKVADI